MAVDPDFAQHVSDLFAGMGPMRTGRMFGGLALFVEDDVMFAMISGADRVWMKSDASTHAQFVAAGSEPFSYMRATGQRQATSLMSLPDAAMDDPDEAMIWARLALGPARAAAAKKRAAKARKSARKSAP